MNGLLAMARYIVAYRISRYWGRYLLPACCCTSAVLTYGEALSDRIVSYRIAIFCVISYRIVSLMAVSCHHYGLLLRTNETS